MVNDRCRWIVANEMTPTHDPGLEEGLGPFNVRGVSNLRTFVFGVLPRPRESVKSVASSSEAMK